MALHTVLGLLLVTTGATSASPATPVAWNVRHFGAVGNARADDTSAFQKALDVAAKAGGGIVNVPAGDYRINGTLSIPGGVTLQGTFRSAPTTDHENRPRMDGSVLQAYAGRGSATGKPFITLAGSNATLTGFIVTYPQWKQTDVPPIPYPPTVYAGASTNVCVSNCCLVNSYEALHFQNAARFLVRNVHGYPSYRGLYIDNCCDISRVENCHFWPFAVNYKPSDPYCHWINTHGVAFEFARTDWQYVLNTFCFGYGVGYKFSGSKNGSCNGNFVGIGADSCEHPVLVKQLQGPGLLITNGEFVGRWSSAHAVGLEIAPGAGPGKVSLNNCSFWGPIDRCIWSRSPKVNVTAIGVNFLNYAMTNPDSPAIQIDAGTAIIQGNTFGEGQTQVRVGPKAASVIISGNLAQGGVTVDNQAGARAQIFGNETSGVVWTKAARAHYVLNIGGPGDHPYLRNWNGQESASEWPHQPGTKRWSTDKSELLLPVNQGDKYQLTMSVYVPNHAISPRNGVYLGDQRLASFPQTPGPATITCRVPKSKVSPVVLTLRVKGWCPKNFSPSSTDTRILGIGVRRVVMTSTKASKKIFDANTGNWRDQKPKGRPRA